MRNKIIIFIFIFFCNSNTIKAQEFITLDNETLDFVDDVIFRLYSKNKIIHIGNCVNNGKTKLLENIQFDSIVFNQINYKELTIKKENFTDIVLLQEKKTTLKEIILTYTKDNYIVLGEKNKFVKRRSVNLLENTYYGIVFENETKSDLEIAKIEFFIEKIKHKTAYKINIYEFKDSIINIGHQFAELGNLISTTDTLFLYPNQKNSIVHLFEEEITLKKEPIFISIELISYYDENGLSFIPNYNQQSKLKFCISERCNYFAKTVDKYTGIVSKKMLNINAMVNYDFKYAFFKEPHKSSIVTPAILLYTKKIN